MSAVDDGGAAFPITLGQIRDQCDGHGAMTGMTLRDYFAGQAAVYAADTIRCYKVSPEEVAANAYALADAMLAERAKP